MQRRQLLEAVAAGAAAAPLLRAAVSWSAEPSPSFGSNLMGKEKFVDVGGIRTRYFDAGDGQPIVLIHGGQWPATASADGWNPIFDELARHFHVYAFDKLGMGYTDLPKSDSDYSMNAIVRHASGFIDALGIRRAVVLGHSRGALPAARITVDRPELVSHLVILDTNALSTDDVKVPDRTDPPAREKPPTRDEIRRAELTSRMSYLKNFVTDAYVDAVYRIAQLPKTQEADRKFRELRDRWVAEHPEEMKQNPKLGNNAGDTVWWMYRTKAETLQKIQARALKSPTVIIWGMNDSFAPLPLGVNVMQTISKVVDRTEFHAINRCGHFVASEHPVETARLITGFVQG